MEDLTQVLAIASPSVVALASLLVQAASTRAQMKTERAKIFYQDRISALRGIIKAVSEIERNAKLAIQFRDVIGGTMGCQFQDLWENKEGRVPPERHQILQGAVYGATLHGRKNFDREIGENRIFYPPEVSSVIEEIEEKYFRSLPEPLHPELLDPWLETHIPFLTSYRKQLIEKSQGFMMLAA